MSELNNFDKIMPVRIEDEMKDSYIDYAMSVIVARALPDVRDGLKPVHRRILHSMNELNLDYGKAHKKSARITGDVMGKYHPHGESSIYDALVRMAQDFSMRYMLVDGHGNFGSIDGDRAAAQRYTEARLSRISMEMISDIEKDTVDFLPNYTEEFFEPAVLPSKFPNLLVNGSSGIAVGMATNIPPHNLTEAVDGCLMMIDNFINEGRETTPLELMTVIHGPDFPTAATILGTAGIKAAYLTGRGKVTVRSLAEIETMEGGTRERIVVSEIPYQVNKARLVEKIAELVKEKKVEGISDLRDESDRHGIKIVVELKKDANANVILNSLYKYTQLQETYGIIMLALVNNEPKVLNLQEMLWEYIKHQKEVVTRRTRFDLAKALKREHLVEGFIKALDLIDEIISIIRSNHEISVSKEIIIERFGFSQEQADAIVEMRLRALSGLEREKLEKELFELKILITELKEILEDEKRLYGVIRAELSGIRQKFGDERRTKIVPYEGEIDIEDLINDGMSVITLSHLDYIKRQGLDTYRLQNRGGRGIIGVTTRGEDLIKDLFIAKAHDDMLFLTSFGRIYKIKAYEIPEAGRTARGTAVVNLLNLNGGEKIASIIPVRDYQDGYLMMVTKKGIIKKTALKLFSNIKKSGIIAINIREEDELISVLRTTGEDHVFVATKSGMGIRFGENNVRGMGRSSTGVKAIRLSPDDIVIGAEILKDGLKILFASEMGYGKSTETDAFRIQSRSGKGLRAYKVTPKTGCLIGITTVNDKEELMLINSDGIIIRIRVCDISTTGRATSGVKLINLAEGIKLVSLAKIAEDYIAEMESAEAAEAEYAALEADTEETISDDGNENKVTDEAIENEASENEAIKDEAIKDEVIENEEDKDNES